MKTLFAIIGSFTVTIICWGVYGPVIHQGQAKMALPSAAPNDFIGLRPLICVGLAYFLIGVLAAGAYLRLRGEKGCWTLAGTLWSLAAGTAGALGVLGVILAFSFGGSPIFVMPLVFGGAPVVNSFLTITLARKVKEVGPVFLAGLLMVLLGSIVVLVFRPHPPATVEASDVSWSTWLLSIAAVAMTIVTWGAYGPILHKGQMKMEGSRLRPLICVGVAYCVIAGLIPGLLLSVWAEPSHFSFSGSMWSLAAGATGAFGALGIIMAFNFGGKPMYVMPLVFGGAPVVNTFVMLAVRNNLSEVRPLFLSGLILVIAGAAVVLMFAPKGEPPKPVATSEVKPDGTDEEAVAASR